MMAQRERPQDDSKDLDFIGLYQNLVDEERQISNIVDNPPTAVSNPERMVQCRIARSH
jgi:hypothetical protein